MTTDIHREIGLLTRFTLTIALVAYLAVPLGAAFSVGDESSPRCPQCADCTGDAPTPRVVGLRIYNQPPLSEASVSRILAITNHIWSSYGVSFEASEKVDAITVVVSGSAATASMDLRPAVLGDTLFTSGHATPYIHLWPGNATALAIGS